MGRRCGPLPSHVGQLCCILAGQVRDGQLASDPLIGRYCGSRQAFSVSSSTGAMEVRFVTDSANSQRGFTASASAGPRQSHELYTHPFNGPFSGTTQLSRYRKGKTNLDFTEARDSEWQWHQPGRMQVCTSLQTDNHASTPPLSFLQAECPSCHPTNSI